MRAARCVLSEVLQNSKKSSFRWTNATLRVYLVFCFSNDALNSKGNGKGYTIIPPIFISFRIQSLFEEDFLKQFHQLWIPNKIHFIGICEGFWFHSLCHYDDVLLTIFQKISFILVFRFHQILWQTFFRRESVRCLRTGYVWLCHFSISAGEIFWLWVLTPQKMSLVFNIIRNIQSASVQPYMQWQ